MGRPQYTGDVWSDAYLISPAVHTAWDNFWDNAKAVDGIGLQDHYANVWKHIAARYRDNETVIGYDIMNEPFIGSEAQLYMYRLFDSFADVINAETGNNLTAEEVGQMWNDPQQRYQALSMLDTKSKYARVIDAVYEINSSFEINDLQPFYQKVANAIREEDDQKILFLNHSYFTNIGLRTALQPLQSIYGGQDNQICYAAHGYDLLIDTEHLSSANFDRIELIFERINENGNYMNVPVLVGEWGGFGQQSGIIDLGNKHMEIFQRYLLNNTYWDYRLGAENYPAYNEVLIRPYPFIISGTLLSYHHNKDNGEFYCRWEESSDITEPTIIYIPDIDIAKNISFTGGPDRAYTIERIVGGKEAYLIIESFAKDQEYELTFVYD